MQGRGQKIRMKYVWRVIFLWLCVCGSAISVKAEDTKTYRSEDEKWDYIILDEQDKTVEIVAAYDKAVSSGGVVVPSHIEDYKVLGIGAEVFKDNESITFVTFEEGIQYIGCGCFWACTSLENVTFPDTLQRIEFDAFNSCIELEQVDIPAAVEEIGPAAFWYTPWLNNARENSEDHLVICNNILIDGRMATGEVDVPDTVTAIVGGSFYGPDSILVEDESSVKGASLQSVTIPGSVKEIGELAFSACNQLEKVEMKEGVEAVGRNSFAKCISLTEISIPTTLHTFGAYAFWYTPWLVNARNEREDHLVIRNDVLLDGVLTTGEIAIPDGVREIVPYCFYAPSGTGTSFSKSEVSNITIPDSVVSIGFGAFAYCYDLAEVRMPANLTQLNDYCFIGCKDLASITIPDSVKQIGNKVFVNCTKLKKIVLPEGIQKITGMFVNDTDDITIVIPEKVTDISSLGLLQYKKLFLFVVADGSVENYLKENNFTHYTTYESSTSKPVDPDSESNKQPEPENPESDKQSDATGKETEQTTEQKNTTQQENKIGVEYTVKGCQYTVFDGKNIAFSGVQDSSAEKLTIPAYVKVDGVSYKVTRIEDGACKGMTNLKSVTIGNSITKIGRQAFMNCKNLKKVQIGSQVTSIEKQAFCGNKKLKQVVIKSTKLKKIGKKAFSGIPKTVKFKVPRGKGDAYKKMIQKSGR